MILYPNCKINLGLYVESKRDDGFHNISTVFYPVSAYTDVLEILHADTDDVEFSSSGLLIDCPKEDNLCIKAYNLIRRNFNISGVKIHLHKIIPFGAGLGGGSSDAAFVIKGLNKLFKLSLTDEKMEALAAEIGSDTSFFIKNKPCIASGRGEILTPIPFSLEGTHIVIVKPDFGVSTKQAYSMVRPDNSRTDLKSVVLGDRSLWSKLLVNDFEPSVAGIYPEINSIKKTLYDSGAFYASMSGSGSAVFGLFDDENKVKQLKVNENTHCSLLK